MPKTAFHRLGYVILADRSINTYFIIADIQIMVAGIEGNSCDPLIIPFGQVTSWGRCRLCLNNLACNSVFWS